MRAIIIFLAAIAEILFASCNKKNFTKINGTINGVPAITLYGNSNKNADFILLSTNQADKEISYNGITYPYYYISSGSAIFINVSSTNVQKASLDTGATTTLTIAASTQSIFGSSLYISK